MSNDAQIFIMLLTMFLTAWGITTVIVTYFLRKLSRYRFVKIYKESK